MTGDDATRRKRPGPQNNRGLPARSSAAGLYVTFYYLGGSLGATVTDWFWQRWLWPGCVALLGSVAALSLVLAWLSSRPHEVLPHAEPEIVGD